MKKVLFSIFICFLICGCNRYPELNDYIIASTLAIDYKNNSYTVSVLTKDSSNKTNPNVIYTGKGKNLTEAFEDLALISPKEIYKGHLSVVILSKQIASKGISEPIKYLLTDPQINHDFYIILSRGRSTLNLLKETNNSNNDPSKYIIQKIKNINSSTSTLDYTTVLKKITNHENLVINSFDTITQNSKKQLKLDTLGYFKKDKLIGWTNSDESKGINIINNNMSQMTINLKCSSGYISVDIKNITSKIKVNKSKIVKIIIMGDSYVQYKQCNTKDLNKKINKEIHKYVNQAIKLSQQKNIDIFNIGRLYYQNYPKEYQKQFWINNYDQLSIKTNINIKLNQTSSNQIVERILNEKNN